MLKGALECHPQSTGCTDPRGPSGHHKGPGLLQIRVRWGCNFAHVEEAQAECIKSQQTALCVSSFHNSSHLYTHTAHTHKNALICSGSLMSRLLGLLPSHSHTHREANVCTRPFPHISFALTLTCSGSLMSRLLGLLPSHSNTSKPKKWWRTAVHKITALRGIGLLHFVTGECSYRACIFFTVPSLVVIVDGDVFVCVRAIN